MASKEKQIAVTDPSDVLPPELFPYIATALVRARSKKTLLNLICANQHTFSLCYPIFMSEIDLSAPSYVELDDLEEFIEGLRERVTAFSVDAFRSGKFSLIKSLKLDVAYAELDNDSRSALVEIWDRSANLERLDCYNWSPDDPDSARDAILVPFADETLAHAPGDRVWDVESSVFAAGPHRRLEASRNGHHR